MNNKTPVPCYIKNKYIPMLKEHEYLMSSCFYIEMLYCNLAIWFIIKHPKVNLMKVNLMNVILRIFWVVKYLSWA